MEETETYFDNFGCSELSIYTPEPCPENLIGHPIRGIKFKKGGKVYSQDDVFMGKMKLKRGEIIIKKKNCFHLVLQVDPKIYLKLRKKFKHRIS